jgi:hypothetical protein
MPNSCFSYPADVPPGTGTRDAVQSDPPGLRRMPTTSCFRYEADVPPGLRRMTTTACFSYPYMCFSYPSDVPPGTRNRDAAQPDRLGLRRMPSSTCFRY